MPAFSFYLVAQFIHAPYEGAGFIGLFYQKAGFTGQILRRTYNRLITEITPTLILPRQRGREIKVSYVRCNN